MNASFRRGALRAGKVDLPRKPDEEYDLPDTERQLREAFEAFRHALQTMLEDEARASVKRSLARLQGEGGPFSISDAQVEVSITGLTVAAQGSSPPRQRAPRSASSSTSRGRGSAPKRRRGATSTGAARGGVREALLASFDKPGAELTIGQLGSRLEATGVKSTANNVHQQLRRLVQAGEIKRTGRGIYTRTA